MRSENLYQIKKGNHGISKSLAETINRLYPNYSVGWLLTGDPTIKMNIDTERVELKNDTIKGIPVYNRIGLTCKPIYTIYISEELVNRAQLAMISKKNYPYFVTIKNAKNDSSMKPEYTLTPDLLTLLTEISRKLGMLEATQLTKLPVSLRRAERIKTISSTLQIEGNTMTIEQVTDFIEGKRVIASKKDLTEVRNAFEVYDRFNPIARCRTVPQ